MYPKENRLDRTTALRLWTEANTWFSNEEGKKGSIKAGQLADLAVLGADYMTVAENQIRDIESVLTIVDGKITYGSGPFSKLAPPLPPASPDWSPVGKFGGYYKKGGAKPATKQTAASSCCAVHGTRAHAWLSDVPVADAKAFWGALGCSCWAV